MSDAFACAGGGYNGTAGQIGGNGWATWQYWNHGSAYGSTQRHNCTTYAAFRLQQNGYPYPNWTGDAKYWDTQAASRGVLVDQTPAVGAIAQWNGGTAGHVGYVEAVTSTYVEITSDNWGGPTNRFRVTFSSPYRPDNYIHFKDVGPSAPAVAQYAGHLVQWADERPSPVTTWLVGPDLHRTWVRDGGTYDWMKGAGAPGPTRLSADQLKALPDRAGVSATTDQLGVNWTALRGTTVWSTSNGYQAVFQWDGNFVVYAQGRAVWATGTNYRADRLVMQSDGNLVLYGPSGYVWASHTARGFSRMVMQGDGNLVIYGADGRPSWCTRTNGGTNQLSNPAGYRL